MHERCADAYVHRNHRPGQANRRVVMVGCMLRAGSDIPKPGHLLPAAAEAPAGKRGQVRKDKHGTVGKNKSPTPNRNLHHRERRSFAEGRRLQQKAAVVNTPPAYLSRAAVLGSLHQNNSSCIRLGERARDLDLPLRSKRTMVDHQQPQPKEMNVVRAGGLDLPPGFHFYPSDFEIVKDYLMNKAQNRDFTCAIGEVDLTKTEPWDLPREAKMTEKEWYFFYKKDRKYPTGLRANRATKAGYWKATGKDKEVYKSTEGEEVVLLVGMKKTLVFYEGRAPRGNKTNWVMHEYRLEGSGRLPSPASASSSATNATVAMRASISASKDEWVVCRVFHKTTGIRKTTAAAYQVAMPDHEIDRNQSNIPAMPMQFPILQDFAMDPVPPYYSNPNIGARMPLMMPPMAGIGDAGGLQINGALFDNPMAMPPSMNFYHQMGMGATAGQMGMGSLVGQMGIGDAGQMDMGAAGAGGFFVAAPKSRSSLMVSQKDEQANAAEISSMMSVTGPGSTTTTIEMDGIWKYKY